MRILAFLLLLPVLAAQADPPDATEAPRAIPGFTSLGWRKHTCDNDVEGAKSFRVAVYRCDAYAKAIGLAPERWATDTGAEALDTEFVLLPPGGLAAKVALGSPDDEINRDDDETPREVELAPFLIARTETTQRVFAGAGGRRGKPAQFAGDRLPAETLDWEECRAFAAALALRLPTDSEWELACRGGTRTPFCYGSTITSAVANYHAKFTYREGDAPGEYRGRTTPVGQFPPNAYGLFDFHGNVWEWCSDMYLDTPDRSRRGGCWGHYAKLCRSANRGGELPTRTSGRLGFRAAASVEPAPATGSGS